MLGSGMLRTMFLTNLDSFLSSLILYRSIERFVAMKKLKSSANKNEKPNIARAFWNVSLISSAARSFKKSNINALSETYSARQLFSG